MNNNLYENKIVLGDCLEKLKELPDNSIDVVITDPPYGTKTNQRGDSFMVGEFSNVLPLALPEIYRVLKPDGAFYCFTSWTQMAEWLLRFQQYFKLQNILIWDKQRHSGCFSPNSWQFTWEGVFFGIKGKRKVRKYQRDVLISNEKGKRQAMQKPVDIIEQMILASTDEGMIILDPFAGTGSVLLAAKNTHRKYIGIEISQEFVGIANKRLAI
jgi:DNA modification methylase